MGEAGNSESAPCYPAILIFLYQGHLGLDQLVWLPLMEAGEEWSGRETWGSGRSGHGWDTETMEEERKKKRECWGVAIGVVLGGALDVVCGGGGWKMERAWEAV